MGRRVLLFDDGVHRQEATLQPSENRLYVETKQPGRRKILADNVRDALNSKAHRDLRIALRIPEDDFPMICKQYPELVKGTQEEQLLAVERIAKAHPEFVRVSTQQRIFPNARQTV